MPRSNVKLGRRTGQNSIVTNFLCFLLMALLRSCRYPIHNFNVILISAIISAIILIVYYVAINYGTASHYQPNRFHLFYYENCDQDPNCSRISTDAKISLIIGMLGRFISVLSLLSPGTANLSRKCSAATPTQAEGENNYRTLNLKAMCGR